MDQQIFRNPPDTCRGTDFWMLNDRLEDGELVRQLREMHAQGVACVIARTYIGLKSDYPGADFKHKMHVVVDEAKALGMTIFMQAGYMPEAVLDLPEKYVLGNIRQYRGGTGAGEMLCSHGEYDYCLAPSLNILDMLNPDATQFYVMQSYDRMWADFRDEFGKTITSVWVDEPSYAHAELPWTPGLPAAYEALWGEAFDTEKIYLLFENDTGAARYRYRYWRTVLHLITNSYFKAVRDWCNQNGVMFSGHLMNEDKMENQIRATCFTMPCYKYFDMPGIDNLETALDWTHGQIKPLREFDRHWRDFGSYNTPMQCQSASHQAGKYQILAEMYGVSTENLNFRDQKFIFDHFATMGINHRSVHGLFYSLRGRGKRSYPPHVNYYQPYWPQYRHLTDTIARESAFLRAGKPVRDTVVIHPIDTAFELYQAGNQIVDRNEDLRNYDMQFNRTLRTLMAMQENFELGDEDTIALMGEARGAEFVIGEMSYRTVILPNCRNLRKTTWEKLQSFMAQGGRVLVLGDAPTELDGEPANFGDGWAKAQFAADLTELGELLRACPHRYTYTADEDGTETKIYPMQEGDKSLYFVLNGDCRMARTGTLRVHGHFAARRLDPATGDSAPFATAFDGGDTLLRLTMAGGESLLLELTPAEETQTVAVPAVMARPFAPTWRARRHGPNALVCEMFRFARDGEALSEKTYPILAIQEILTEENYHGLLTLDYAFTTRIPLTGVKLVAENPADQQFRLDGAAIGNQPDGWFCDIAFETLPLPALSIGTHHITVQRHFEPLRRAKMAVTALFENLPGVELEQLLLIGDFGVFAQREQGPAHVVRLNPHMVLDAERTVGGTEWTSQGNPFYTGVLDIETELELTEDDLRRAPTFAVAGVFAGTAEVFVNGKPAGNLLWAPYEVPLKNAHAGVNTLTVRLYGTLRNLLGPWHRPQGELGAAWGGYLSPALPWLGIDQFNGTTDPLWYEHREVDHLGWTESYLLSPLGITGAEIQLRFM